jgi:hypothetical protein
MTNTIKIDTDEQQRDQESVPASDTAPLNLKHLTALRAAYGHRVRIVVVANDEQRAELGDLDLTEYLDGSIDAELGDQPLSSDEVVATVRARVPVLNEIRAGVVAAFREFERDVLLTFAELATSTTAQTEACAAGIRGAMDGLELDLLQSLDELATTAS